MNIDKKKSVAAQILDIGRRVYERGYVVSNDGNISARIDEKTILVTPSGVSKGRMTEDMLVVVDLDGHILEGKRHPSSETPMHLEVYKLKPEVQAVVHAHAPIATAFAVANRPIIEPYCPEMIVGLGEVPVAPFGMPSTEEIPASIHGLLDGHALLLANHGVLTWGQTLDQAYDYLEQVEYAANLILNVERLGGGVLLSDAIKERMLGLLDNYKRLAGARED